MASMRPLEARSPEVDRANAALEREIAALQRQFESATATTPSSKATPSNDAVVERSRARVRALERELALANEEREREREMWISRCERQATELRALAASAMLAIRGDAPDEEGARRLVDAGRGLVNGFAEPRELACAEAWIGVVSDIKMFGVSTDVGTLEAVHEAEPKNFDAVRALALARFASGDQSCAFDVALLAVKAGFGSNEIREEGKKLVVQLISACAPCDPLAEATRKRLASAWFI